jgi:2-polyprenyl-3-methyl-5-hydroxy-6-metoxy-1,4-benzoquinol methylase
MKNKADQTIKSFGEKWKNNPDLVFDETSNESSDVFNWIIRRNGWATPNGLRSYLYDKKRILDAGCGNGRVTNLLHNYSVTNAEIIGIDGSSYLVAAANLKEIKNITIHQADLMVRKQVEAFGKFDFIYCQEVLHHTENPYQSFSNLCQILSDKGEIGIYVYKKKAPIREYTDDYIRNEIQNLSYEQAEPLMNEISQLGKVLSDLKINIKLPSVKLLEIEAGEYDLQRFIYHFFFKCFWNDAYDLKSNTAINFDWYHPQTASRHTIEEVREWFSCENIEIVHEYHDPYGITVRGRKI